MSYFLLHFDTVLKLFWEHLWVSGLAIGAALLIALPLGWLLFSQPGLNRLVLGVLGVLYTIPSIALIILLVPLFGLNKISVFVALVVYCQVVLVRNILAGLENIPADIREAAVGLGMTRWQLAYQVEFPLALPVILAGVRVAAVVSISIATIGAKFGAGGLGVLLFEGIAQYRLDKLWNGTIFIAILALSVYWGLRQLEHYFVRGTFTKLESGN
jgi:osmoprotectant transport system permease protein